MSESIKFEGSKKKSEAKAQDREDLKAKIAELEAKVAAGEEAALKRVCSALDLDPEQITVKNVVPKEPEKIISCFVNTPVRVNSTIYHGQVSVPYSTFEVISQAIGQRRMRLLRETTGTKYVLDELSGGGMVPRVVQITDASGERIA